MIRAWYGSNVLALGISGAEGLGQRQRFADIVNIDNRQPRFEFRIGIVLTKGSPTARSYVLVLNVSLSERPAEQRAIESDRRFRNVIE